MLLQSHQLAWVMDMARACVDEAGGDVSIGLTAFERVLSMQALPEAITETPKSISDKAHKKVEKKVRKIEKQVKKLLKQSKTNRPNDAPESKEHFGSEPPDDEPGWTSAGSGKWVKTIGA